MEQLLETSESKTKLRHRLAIKMSFRSIYAAQSNKVFIFSVIWQKHFCKHEILLQYIIVNKRFNQ